jgi:hypothetical protein
MQNVMGHIAPERMYQDNYIKLFNLLKDICRDT